VGAVTDVVKRHVPASYRAMIDASNAYYGITQLQALADYVQFRLFATVPGAGNEAAVWSDLTKREFIGKVTTLQFIPAAVDFWGDQLDSESVQGPSENVSYRDPRPDLWKLFEKLQAEVAELAPVVGVPPVGLRSPRPGVTYYDNGRGVFVTPSPLDVLPPYADPSVMDLLPWGTPTAPYN
jgi:hypothetical protein